ncbi:SDR family NAD(P)-dependent oxidoreductase [Ramlibacter sp.]|uniref:SDR family NAD(P)-dependent oxidoreductase n=1 Tax=Ramlibacter sp. TaxID=1917967 RepID=UPI003D10DA68
MEAQPVVLVTGAAGQLGRAVATRLRDDGARLLLVDRATGPLASFAGEGVEAIEADLLQVEQVRAAVERGVARFGRIDAVCHIAGGFRMGPAVHETTARDWEFLMDLNARSLVHVANAVVPGMISRGRGAIVTVGAAAALRGGANMGAYAASKSAVIRLTESMSAELREHGINVNCVLPSIIDTPDNRSAMPQADPSRWVAPEKLASVIAFLLSDDASAVHGASIPVTGRV